MKLAGAADTGVDAERKGLGTPAPKADIIEKLVYDGFVERKKKQIIPTEDGIKLIGELPMQEFMGGIENMVKKLVWEFGGINEEKCLFGDGAYGALGKCPKCGGDVAKGKYGAYCRNKCGMNVSRAMDAELSDSQVKSLLNGKKIHERREGGYGIPVSVEIGIFVGETKQISRKK